MVKVYVRSVIEASPLGFDDYVATLKFSRVTDGDHTFAEWSAEFRCPSEREGALIDMIGQSVFQQGFSALKTHFRSHR